MATKVVVTGAAGQIGSEIIRLLQMKKYDVIGADINAALGKGCEYLDICSHDEVERFLENTRPEIVINNAGVGVFSSMEKRSFSEFEEVFRVNMWGTFNMCQKAIKQFQKDGGGLIINIASIYGVKSSDFRIYGDSKRNNSEIYSMTKAAVISLTKYIAAHYGHENIRCNSVSPGGVFNGQSAEFVSNYNSKVPLRRMASANDIAKVIGFLASEDANYINGENVIVDGGFSAW